MDKDTFRLFPYQVAGVRFLTTRNGAILGDRVGLGKTFQAIQAAIDMGFSEVLIVVPLVLKDWWIEAITFIEDVNNYKVMDVIPEWRHIPKTPAVLTSTRTWVLIHPEQLVNNYVKRHGHKLYVNWDVVIVDEVWKFKNPKAQRTKNLWNLSSDYRWGLSGSVGAQSRRLIAKDAQLAFNPVDFWALLHWAAPRQFPSLWPFAEEYATTTSTFFGGTIYGPAKNTEKLAEQIAPYLLVRRLADVGQQLPPITYVNVPLTMTDRQAVFYKDMKERVIVELLRDPVSGEAVRRAIFDFTGLDNAIIIKSARGRFIRLHQVVSDLTVYTKDCGKGIKYEWLAEYLESEDEPAVIFTNYRHTKAELEKYLDDKGVGDRYKVLTYKKGSHGLNLQDWHILIQWDLPLDFIEENQAVGRIHRTGQDEPCTVYRLIVGDSVDEQTLELIENKAGHSETFINWLRSLAEEAGLDGTYMEGYSEWNNTPISQ